MKRICFSVVILTLTCGSVGAQDTEANKEAVKRWIEAVWQDHDRSHRIATWSCESCRDPVIPVMILS